MKKFVKPKCQTGNYQKHNNRSKMQKMDEKNPHRFKNSYVGSNLTND